MKLHNIFFLTLLATFVFQDSYAQTLASAPQAAPVKATAAPAANTQPQPKDPQKFDTTLPIEITSDSLEVLQHENKAVFKGNVVAVQGEVRLKSDVMIVHYKNKDKTPPGTQAPQQKPASPPPPAKSGKDDNKGTAGDMGAITSIEVEGNVFMATPQESAKGDKGNYDVPTRMLHLTGGNVVLTRDKNIMRGNELVYNMETGRSILTSPKRVDSVFVPNKGPDTGTPAK